MLEQDVRILPVGFADVDGHQGDVLQDEVREAAEVGQGAGRGHFRADDDVRAHRAGDVDREVVAGTAVAQDHAFHADRTEVDRNGHGRTHGIDHVAGRPVLFLHGVHVGGHAIERNGKGVEFQGILVADRHGTQGVPDVESEQVAVRHAKSDLAHHLAHHVT